MTVQIVDTPEKFQPMAQELVPPLLELLRARNDLEQEIHRRFQALEAEKPARYDPLFQDPEGQVTFTMKSAKRATVETSCRKSWEQRYRFTLRLGEDGWKIGKVEYCFGGEASWHAEHYV